MYRPQDDNIHGDLGPTVSQRVHVGIWYILRAQRGSATRGDCNSARASGHVSVWVEASWVS